MTAPSTARQQLVSDLTRGRETIRLLLADHTDRGVHLSIDAAARLRPLLELLDRCRLEIENSR